MMNQIQKMIDENPYVSGQAKPTNVIESSNYVLYASAEGIRHILDRHADEYAPGSLFVSGIEPFITQHRIAWLCARWSG